MAFPLQVWQTPTPPESTLPARLAEFEAFHEAMRLSGVVLREAKKKTQAVFGIQHTPVAAAGGQDDETDNFTYIPGLCRILERLYFNKKNHTPAAPQAAPPKKKKKKKKKKPQILGTNEPKQIMGAIIDKHRTNSCLAKKKLHGSIVHFQIQQLVERFIASVRDRGDQAHFLRETEQNSSQWDPCALQFMTHLVERGLLPLASECIVFDPIANIATAIDLVALDSARLEVVFVEIKSSTTTGAFTAAGLPNRFMREAPFAAVEDSKYHRASVQSIASLILSKHSKVPFVPDRCVIVHVSPHKARATEYELPDWYSDDLEQALYAALIQDHRDRLHAKPECLPLPAAAAAKTDKPPRTKKTKRPAGSSPKPAAKRARTTDDAAAE